MGIIFRFSLLRASKKLVHGSDRIENTGFLVHRISMSFGISNNVQQ